MTYKYIKFYFDDDEFTEHMGILQATGYEVVNIQHESWDREGKHFSQNIVYVRKKEFVNDSPRID